MPPVGWSSTSGSASVYGYGNLYQGLYLQGQGQQSGISVYTGGHYLSRPWAKCNLTLIDSSKEQIVWTGLSVTTGGSKSKFEDYVRVGVAEAVNKLKDDGVLKTQSK